MGLVSGAVVGAGLLGAGTALNLYGGERRADSFQRALDSRVSDIENLNAREEAASEMLTSDIGRLSDMRQGALGTMFDQMGQAGDMFEGATAQADQDIQQQTDQVADAAGFGTASGEGPYNLQMREQDLLQNREQQFMAPARQLAAAQIGRTTQAPLLQGAQTQFGLRGAQLGQAANRITGLADVGAAQRELENAQSLSDYTQANIRANRSGATEQAAGGFMQQAGGLLGGAALGGLFGQ